MEAVAFIFIAALVFHFVVKPIIKGFNEGVGNAPAKRKQSDSPIHDWPELGLFDFEVVDESNYQPALESLVKSSDDNIVKALLVPENDNRYDNKAVCIVIDDMTVGYLSKQDARSFRRRLSQKGLSEQVTSCLARIYGGQKNKIG